MKTELEEAAEKEFPLLKLTNHSSDVYVEEENLQLLGHRKSFIKGAKWQMERSYSEEEIENAFNAGFNYANDKSGNIPNFEDFIKQYKKK